jgi:hypothetical protein
MKTKYEKPQSHSYGNLGVEGQSINTCFHGTVANTNPACTIGNAFDLGSPISCNPGSIASGAGCRIGDVPGGTGCLPGGTPRNTGCTTGETPGIGMCLSGTLPTT